MWRVHLFLLLSTCFLIPYDAKPTTGSSTSASTLSEARRSSHIGRLAAKDLADLLLASMQARGIKLTESQHSTIKSLRSMETTEQQGGAVLLQVGMDVIIDVLIGSNADASCERVIKDIKKSSDKNSLTLGLKSFLALCAFNNIECSQKQVVQIIKSTTSAKQSETAIQGTRITRTALEQAGKSTNIKGDRDSIVSFLQARSVPELSAILSTLLQVCGASSVEAQNIVQNLIEMGPKDSTGVNVLQINGFSTLIVSLMDSLTSIANGNKSGFCAATPESWIVRLLDMGVAKVIIMGLMTALDRSLPTSPNALIQQGNAVANLVDADVSKSSPTSKRASGSLPVIGNLLGNSIASGPTNVANQGGNTITTGPKNLIKGSGNTILSAVDANVLAGVGVNALNSITGVVGGSNGGGGSSSGSNSGSGSGLTRSQNIANQLGNNISLGPKNVVSGSGNTIASLVDAQVPVGADVNILSSALGTVTGGSGGSGGVAGGLLGGGSGSGSSRSQNTANRFGNEITTGPKNIVNGSGNTIASLVDAQVPVGAVVNILNNNRGTVTGGSGGSSGVAGGLLGGGSGSSRSQNTANRFGNEISTGPKNIVNGSRNTIASLVDAQVPVGADVNVLSRALGTVTGGSGGSSGASGGLLGGVAGGLLGGGSGSGSSRSQNTANRLGNEISTGPKNIVTGSGNTIANLVDAQIPVGADVNILSSALGTVTGGSSGSGSVAGGLLGGATGGLLGGGSGTGSSRSQNIANKGGNTITTGPKNVINGSNNSILKAVDLDLPVGLGVNLLQSAVGTVSGSSSGSGGVLGGATGGLLGGLTGTGSGSSQGQNIANMGGNQISTGPKNIVTGNSNSIVSLVDATVPVNLAVNALSSVVGSVIGGGAARNDVVQVVDQQGNRLMDIWDKDGVTAGSGGIGNDLSNTVNRGPKQIVMGDDNNIVKLVNLDASVLARLDLANAIRGSSGACNGIGNKLDNELNTGPENIIEGNRNTLVTLVDLNLDVLANLNLLNTIIGTVGNDCQVTTPEPPTPSPPTPSPPTPTPPTPSPPTPTPPTPYPPTSFPPTPQPPTPSPPTPSPPTPSPNNCYRRYCRKWRTRPSYLCYKNCGGSYVYRP
nr:mucin-19 isoform X6 [Drosophila virilis]